VPAGHGKIVVNPNHFDLTDFWAAVQMTIGLLFGFEAIDCDLADLMLIDLALVDFVNLYFEFVDLKTFDFVSNGSEKNSELFDFVMTCLISVYLVPNEFDQFVSVPDCFEALYLTYSVSAELMPIFPETMELKPNGFDQFDFGPDWNLTMNLVTFRSGKIEQGSFDLIAFDLGVVSLVTIVFAPVESEQLYLSSGDLK